MIIVHVANFFIPRLGYQETYLAKLHAQMGHEVHVISSSLLYPKNEYGVLGQFFPVREMVPGTYSDEVPGVTVHRLHSRLEIGLRVWLSRLEEILIELSPTVVFVHGVTNLNALRVALMRSRGTLPERTRIVMDEHMLYSVLKRTVARRVMYWAFYGLFSAVITPWFLRQGTVFVAVTAETKEFMVQKYRIPMDRVSVIPIGVDIDRFTFDREARIRVRKRLGYSREDVVIIHAGKLIAEKGPHLIVRAAIPVMKSHERVRLLFIGAANSNYIAGMKRDIDAAGLADRVTWLPPAPHDVLAEYYSAADIGIWPSQESMTALEVSSCGRPIIVGASKVSLERIAGGGGLSAATEDELRRHIVLLVNDEKLRKHIGDSGRLHMSQEFDWKVIAKAFLDLA